MAISVNSEKIFTIDTKNTTYQMHINEDGILFHSYYGAKMEYSDLTYLSCKAGWGASFSTNPRNRNYFHSHTKEELSVFGNGDFRLTALSLVNSDGTTVCEPIYDSHQILNGKYSIDGLPAFYGEEGETLLITLKDKAYDIYFHMYYGVLAEYDLITKALVIENKTDKEIKIENALSMTLDVPNGTYDMIHFHGAHMRERTYERTRITHLKSTVSSIRGASSHHQNPFVIICDKDANEEYGNAYGVGLVYSGNFVISAEKDQHETTRVVAGINPDGFNYIIAPNEKFSTPEVALVYSNEGFGKLSNCYHKAVRNNLCRGKFKNSRRPVLINNWEATYFDFNADKLVSMAKDAAKIGVELLVMDDGWFGHRDDDCTSLGDWYVNEKKLQGSLSDLVKRVNDEGLAFGIWFEPECISEDSDLYREHPDYCFKVPNRDPQMSRNQLVLDMSRKEVRDNIYNQIVKILNSANITYVKWDFNRHLSDLYSVELPKERQGEIYHRYMLGVYELLERVTSSFPNILFESCSGGGGRFDFGMLYYMPQVWTSDNSDAIDRLKIQYGTSFAYPVRTMGAHVSVCPNHGNARVTPLKTRGNVAYFGTYGLELDITKMTDEEKEEIKRQIVEFKEYYDLIQFGDYYRLLSPFTPEESRYCAWEVVSEDKNEALVCAVAYESKCTVPPETVKVRGLHPDKLYRINNSEEVYLGAALMNGGFWLDYDHVSYPSRLYHITLAK